jgi:hypothetical protein
MMVELTVVNVRHYGADGAPIHITFFDHSTLGSQIQTLFVNGSVFAIYCSSYMEETWRWFWPALQILLSMILYLKIHSKSQHRPFRRVNIMDVVSWHTVAFSYLQCCFLVPVCA